MKIIYKLLLPFLFIAQSCAQNADKLVIYFKFDNYALNSSSQNEIDQRIGVKLFSQINITTYCDTFGTNEYNYKLALRRANTIKQFLINHHIADSIIKIHAIGENVQGSNFQKYIPALNRRGELTFEQIAKENNAAKRIVEDSMSNDEKKYSDSIVNLPDTNELKIDVDKLEIGNVINLRNINFYPGEHNLLPESRATLEILYNTLKNYPELKIEIQGHICCIERGDGLDIETGSMNLSVNRAKEIYDYLIKKGIQRSRLDYKGFGAYHKIASETTELGRITNRRVEIKILHK